jgi:hypothetical protein
MGKRKKRKNWSSEDRARSREVGRQLADRIADHSARLGEELDPRLEVAARKSWSEMTPDERSAERARRDETTRLLQERIAYHEARLASERGETA